MNLRTTLSERSQTQKNIYSMIAFIMMKTERWWCACVRGGGVRQTRTLGRGQCVVLIAAWATWVYMFAKHLLKLIRLYISDLSVSYTLKISKHIFINYKVVYNY